LSWLEAKELLSGLIGTDERPRRAEIPHIRLDCKNTLTLLPQIDLVNELLEEAVVDYLDDEGVVAPRERNRQTTADSDELLLHPEYLLERAYALVNDPNRAYPFNLPFDLRLEETRTYLSRLSI